MKARKALSIELTNDEIRKINDAKWVIHQIVEECDNEFITNDYVLNIEDGWIKIPRNDFLELRDNLQALSGIAEFTVKEVI